jgi:hypothetical protein
MVLCTVCAANHLPKVACLTKSLIDTQPKHQSTVCLMERNRSAMDGIDLSSIRVILASELGIPNFDSFLFRHRVVEACGAVKAQLLLWAMRNFPQEKYFLYLDPDVYAYSRFEELESAFPQIDVLVTPHHLHDEESLDSIQDHMIRTLMCGIYNSGFLAVRRSSVSQEFLEWWNKKLRLFCYCDFSLGLYNEQKWIDVAFSFFEINVFREPGYNVANWNVAKRCFTKANKPYSYLVNGRPLRFFHFSMIDSGRDMHYFRKYLDKNSAVFEAREEYARKVKWLDPNKLSLRSWSYDYFVSGERILDETRFAYREAPSLADECPQPFNESNSSLLARLRRPPYRRQNITQSVGKCLLAFRRF